MAWQDKIRNPHCDLCPLHESAEHVCLMGMGPKQADLMIVGEAPGAREDERHAAFVGPAGKLLTKLLREARIERKDCVITNVAKCRPPGNRAPERSEVKTCVATYLRRELKVVRPRYILCLGNSALRGIVGRSGITKYRGNVVPPHGSLEASEVLVMPTFHPAAALRNPRYLDPIRADFLRLGRLIRGESSPGQRTTVKVVRTPSQLRWLRSRLMEAKEISYDIETTGLDENEEGAAIVSIAFSWEVGQGAVVPLWHHSASWKAKWGQALKFLKPTLERKDAKYIAHNGKFDARWLAKFGVFVPQKFDTMLACHMIDENRSKGLKPLSQIILGVDAYDVGDDIRDAYNMPLKRLCVYNAKDTDYTLRLKSVFGDQLKDQPRVAKVFLRLMMPASNVLTKVERAGMYVDPQRLKKRTKQASKKLGRIEAELMSHVPKGKRDTINFRSPQQLAEWLYDDLGMDVLEETDKGHRSTKESVLQRLAHKHPAPQLLLDYREWYKYLSTYLIPWHERRDQHSRLHPTYKLFGTVTGRLSCESPNLQNVPRNPFGRAILGAAPGWVLVEADYSQIELRLAAMLAGESRMLRSFLTGEDNHLKTAAELLGKRPEDITKDERVKAGKHPNFGFTYAMGPSRFVEQMWDESQVEISLDESWAYYNRFHELYPKFRRWHDRQRRLAHRYGRVSSLIGRVRHLPDIHSSDKRVRIDAEKQAINSPVQSLASDLMLFSMLQIDEGIGRMGRIIASVHDSVLFEVRERYVDEACTFIKETMEDMDAVKRTFGAEITVPIEAEIEVGTHWGEGEEWNG